MIKNPIKNRLQWIDQIKGIAILAIVLFHFFQNYPDQTGLIAIFNRNGARLGYAAVDIFFVMAGFNISYVFATRHLKSGGDQLQINWITWLGKRLSRLYPTYLLAVSTSLLLYVSLAPARLPELFSLKFLLSSFGVAGYEFQAINPGFWFFTVILEAYLFTPVIFKLCGASPTKLLWLGVGIGVLTKLACFQVGQESPFFIFLLQTNFLGSYCLQLCLGFYWGFMYAKYQSFRKLDWVIALGIFAIGISLYIAMAWHGIEIIYMLGFDILFTPFMFIALYLACQFLLHQKNLNLPLGLLGLMGIYSYQIYLIHQPLLFSMLPLFDRLIHFPIYIKAMLLFSLFSVSLTVYTYLFTQLELLLRTRFEQLTAKKLPQNL